ncbi:hypothetical protein LSH36_24g00000 [Paralvinella palmiformis]|uniref:Uncharacterized protein n=1 Tax=Paralvinella palmiformis TaxID=53620 RepID=A0AAD9NHW7_9ANNE|nr:hypothetical protein LSH36_24g00000 [Paralvinella palmiformis]
MLFGIFLAILLTSDVAYGGLMFRYGPNSGDTEFSYNCDDCYEQVYLSNNYRYFYWHYHKLYDEKPQPPLQKAAVSMEEILFNGGHGYHFYKNSINPTTNLATSSNVQKAGRWAYMISEYQTQTSHCINVGQ